MTYIWNRQNISDGPIWSARVGPDELDASFLGQPSYSPELRTFFISDARDYDDEGAIRTFDAVVAFKVGNALRDPRAADVDSARRRPRAEVTAARRRRCRLRPRRLRPATCSPSTPGPGKCCGRVRSPGAALAPITWAQDEVLVGDSSGTLHAFGLPPAPLVGTKKQRSTFA